MLVETTFSYLGLSNFNFTLTVVVVNHVVCGVYRRYQFFCFVTIVIANHIILYGFIQIPILILTVVVQVTLVYEDFSQF